MVSSSMQLWHSAEKKFYNQYVVTESNVKEKKKKPTKLYIHVQSYYYLLKCNTPPASFLSSPSRRKGIAVE